MPFIISITFCTGVIALPTAETMRVDAINFIAAGQKWPIAMSVKATLGQLHMNAKQNAS
jgi:hypothetical protein